MSAQHRENNQARRCRRSGEDRCAFHYCRLARLHLLSTGIESLDMPRPCDYGEQYGRRVAALEESKILLLGIASERPGLVRRPVC